MRTTEEIVSRIREIEGDDFFGFQTSDLLEFVPFNAAKEFLKPEATDEGWTYKTPDEQTVRAEIVGYLDFAWGKANNCRGLLASRSLDHMKAWLWLYGADVWAAFEPRLENYDCYGKYQLAAISEYFGFPWRDHDNGVWCNSEDGPHLGVKDDFSWLPAKRPDEEPEQSVGDERSQSAVTEA